MNWYVTLIFRRLQEFPRFQRPRRLRVRYQAATLTLCLLVANAPVALPKAAPKGIPTKKAAAKPAAKVGNAKVASAKSLPTAKGQSAKGKAAPKPVLKSSAEPKGKALAANVKEQAVTEKPAPEKISIETAEEKPAPRSTKLASAKPLLTPSEAAQAASASVKKTEKPTEQPVAAIVKPIDKPVESSNTKQTTQTGTTPSRVMDGLRALAANTPATPIGFHAASANSSANLSANSSMPAASTLTAAKSLPQFVGGRLMLSSADSVRALQMLQSSLDTLLGAKNLDKTDWGASVLSLYTGKTLYGHNATTPLIPASTTKLFPTFSALEQFGTDYLVRTSVCSDATGELSDGVLQGNIYLVGHGDPLLTVTDLEHLAVQLKNMGIQRITGNIYGDDSFFDRLLSRVEYSGDDDEVQPTGPVSALTVQKNLVTVFVSAGPKVGERVRVQTIPSADCFTFDIQAKVQVVKAKGRRKRWAAPSLTIQELRGNKTGKQHFVVRGTLNPNSSVSRLFFIANPALAAADMFRKRIEMFGITVEGKTELRKTPNTSAILTEFVRPLTEIVKVVNKKSDNFCAEHVFKMLGSPLVSGDNKAAVFSTSSENRSAQASVQQIQSILKDHGIAPNLWTINDGSGLSRRNRIPPATIIKLLDEAARTPFADTFTSSLAVAGLDGTLEHRMRGTSAGYNVIAKTGTHKNVSALAGYVRTKDGEKLAFSFIFNGWGVWKYKQLENRLCEILANFSYAHAAFPDAVLTAQ